MVENLIENVHREDLKPLEQVRAIYRVFQQANHGKIHYNIMKNTENLTKEIRSIGHKLAYDSNRRKLTDEQLAIDKIVRKIGLGYNSIYESLKILHLYTRSSSVHSITRYRVFKGAGAVPLDVTNCCENILLNPPGLP